MSKDKIECIECGESVYPKGMTSHMKHKHGPTKPWVGPETRIVLMVIFFIYMVIPAGGFFARLGLHLAYNAVTFPFVSTVEKIFDAADNDLAAQFANELTSQLMCDHKVTGGWCVPDQDYQAIVDDIGNE